MHSTDGSVLASMHPAKPSNRAYPQATLLALISLLQISGGVHLVRHGPKEGLSAQGLSAS